MKYIYIILAFLASILGVVNYGKRLGREEIKEKSRKKADKAIKAVNKATIQSVAKANEETKDAITRAHTRRDHFS